VKRDAESPAAEERIEGEMGDAVKNAEQRPRSLRHDTRGAVLAEFVITIAPMLLMFFAFVQLAKTATARLAVKHSALVGARAAAVISNGADNNPGQPKGSNQDEIQTAVRAALGPFNDSMAGVVVQVEDRSSRAQPYELVTVTVTAAYKCQVPMGKIICPGGVKVLREVHSMPHQGARYLE
jgi:Flp pilus assembly protein TadG